MARAVGELARPHPGPDTSSKVIHQRGKRPVLFTMIVEYSKTQEAVVQRLAPLFFDSVKFE